MNTDLGDGEKILLRSDANLQRGIETVGGQLFLTTRRLVFESHRLNVKTGRTIIQLRDVEDVWKTWTKFLGLIPIFPNTLAVSTEAGKTYRFVMFGRDKWVRLIRETKQDLRDSNEPDDEQEDEYRD
jgi:hypothetical protein